MGCGLDIPEGRMFMFLLVTQQSSFRLRGHVGETRNRCASTPTTRPDIHVMEGWRTTMVHITLPRDCDD